MTAQVTIDENTAALVILNSDGSLVPIHWAHVEAVAAGWGPDPSLAVFIAKLMVQVREDTLDDALQSRISGRML